MGSWSYGPPSWPWHERSSLKAEESIRDQQHRTCNASRNLCIKNLSEFPEDSSLMSFIHNEVYFSEVFWNYHKTLISGSLQLWIHSSTNTGLNWEELKRCHWGWRWLGYIWRGCEGNSLERVYWDAFTERMIYKSRFIWTF